MAEGGEGQRSGRGGVVRGGGWKRMHEHLRDEESMVALSLDEVRIMGMVSHPNVVTLYDVGLEDDGTPFLVMELVVGLSLSKLKKVNHEPLSTAALVEIIAQAADGLHAAHRARSPTGAPLHILHRHVSPPNILLGFDGRPRLSAFRVARPAGERQQGVASARGVRGEARAPALSAQSVFGISGARLVETPRTLVDSPGERASQRGHRISAERGASTAQSQSRFVGSAIGDECLGEE